MKEPFLIRTQEGHPDINTEDISAIGIFLTNLFIEHMINLRPSCLYFTYIENITKFRLKHGNNGF